MLSLPLAQENAWQRLGNHHVSTGPLSWKRQWKGSIVLSKYERKEEEEHCCVCASSPSFSSATLVSDRMRWPTATVVLSLHEGPRDRQHI